MPDRENTRCQETMNAPVYPPRQLVKPPQRYRTGDAVAAVAHFWPWKKKSGCNCANLQRLMNFLGPYGVIKHCRWLARQMDSRIWLFLSWVLVVLSIIAMVRIFVATGLVIRK